MNSTLRNAAIALLGAVLLALSAFVGAMIGPVDQPPAVDVPVSEPTPEPAPIVEPAPVAPTEATGDDVAPVGPGPATVL